MEQQHHQESHTELPTQYVTFRVGELLFGVDVSYVQEVLRSQPMTPIPLAPKAIKGLVNLRGQIITAIDLGSLLGLESPDGTAPSMNVVIRAEGERVSLLVDSIGDVLEMDEEDYEEIPETVPSHIAAIVQGVFKLKDELLLVLDGKSCTTPAI